MDTKGGKGWSDQHSSFVSFEPFVFNGFPVKYGKAV